jgi:hypothetical protein
MRIVIEHTDHYVHVDGVPCRMWYGVTTEGNRVQVCVARIAPLYGPNPNFDDEAMRSGLRPPSHPTSQAQVIEDGSDGSTEFSRDYWRIKKS